MNIEPGSQLGAYTILESLGPTTSPAEEGELWRARDSQSDREVAIRTLPPSIAGDPERLAKIGMQAKTLAALEHPHAARVYGLEESDQTAFLVTELPEGETLGERLKRGAISIADGLALGLQIAGALETAHDAGILHRDLNPSNIRIGKDGAVKIADFGLPGLLGLEEVVPGSDPNLSHSPTMTVAATHSGSFSGTSAYLAPEQARGDTSDARADIWGFGCILFQILSGQAPFRGKTESDVRAAVLRTDPDWAILPGGIHSRIRFLLERCLEKDPARRPSDMAGVRADIAKTIQDPEGAATPTGAGSKSLVPWAAAVVAAAILGLTASWALAPEEDSAIVRFRMWASQPGGGIISTLHAVSPELAISPDGSRIAFKGLDGRLYLRDRDDPMSRPVQITEEFRILHAPLFSPDGTEIYYVDAPPPDGAPGPVGVVVPRVGVLGQIADPGLDFKRVPVDGGTPTPVLSGRRDEVLDAVWTGNDEILFVDSGGTIQSVGADGGTPVTLLEAPGARHPQRLPGGEWILYSTGDLAASFVIGAPRNASEIVVQSIDNPEDRRVIWEGGGGARYIEATGHIVYQGMIQSGLWAFPFDAGRLARTGDPVPLVEGVIADFALAQTGALAYAVLPDVELPTLSDASGNVLAIVSRMGAIGRQLRVDPGIYRNPRVSPDGSRVAYEFVDASGESHIWVYDLAEDFPQKLTFEGENRNPVWKDDASISFASNREGTWGVYTTPADGSGAPESLLTAPEGAVYRPQAWASDESLVLVIGTEADAGRSGRLAVLPAEGEQVREIAPAEPGTSEFGASLSPDGAWLAYIAECGATLGCARVQRFPPVPGSSFLVSENEAWVQFSPDGGQLVTSRVNFHDVRDVFQQGTTVDFPNSRRINFGGFQAALDNRSVDLRGPAGGEFVAVVPASNSAADAGTAESNDPTRTEIGYIHNFFEVLRARVRPTATP